MIVLAGASASGKTEVAKVLAKKYNIEKVITTTTRPKRIHEVDGADYFFISNEEFLKKIQDGDFVEYTEYNGHYYGSSKDQISSNKCIVIDPKGMAAYRHLNDKRIVIFFLDSLEKTRYKRMLERGDDEEKAHSRIIHDRIAFNEEQVKDVDYHIDSEHNDIDEVADLVYKTYKDHLSKDS